MSNVAVGIARVETPRDPRTIRDGEVTVFGRSDDKRLEKAEARRQRIANHQYEKWLNAPLGRARSAKELGSRWFQCELDIEVDAPNMSAVVFGWPRTTRSRIDDVGGMLDAIEQEGWTLHHAGFIFRPLDSVTRNRSNGNSTTFATGKTVGIYLFANDETPPRTTQPWLDDLEDGTDPQGESAEQSPTSTDTPTQSQAPRTAEAGWYPDPLGERPLRYWDGAAWVDSAG